MINNPKTLKIAVVCTLIIILVFVGVLWYRRYYPTKVPGLVDTQQSKMDSQYPVPNSGGAFAVLYPFNPSNDSVIDAQATMTIEGSVTSFSAATGVVKDYTILKLNDMKGHAIVNDFYVKNNTPIIVQNKSKQSAGSLQDVKEGSQVNVLISKSVKNNAQWSVSKVIILQ